jgi:hypothetical protein
MSKPAIIIRKGGFGCEVAFLIIIADNGLCRIKCVTLCHNIKKMAYNQQNLFARITEIKSITFEARRNGQSQRWVYDNLIRDRYRISYATYNNYLSRGVRSEERRLNS